MLKRKHSWHKFVIFLPILLPFLLIGVINANWDVDDGEKVMPTSDFYDGQDIVEPVARIGNVYYHSIQKAIQDGVLNYCYSSSYETAYTKNGITIEQNNTNAWVDTDALQFSYVATNPSYQSSNPYTNGLPTDAGYYKVRVDAKSGSETPKIINTRIVPKAIYVKSSSIIQVNYDSSSRTFASFLLPKITGITFTDNQQSQSTYAFSDYAVIGIDNGMYYYLNTSVSTTYKTEYDAFVDKCTLDGLLSEPESGVTNVVGSTYAVTLVSTNPNYVIMNRGILKYKTALVGTTYYTIEDAIANAGSTVITLEGNSSGAKTYVATCFSAIPLEESPYSSFSYTLTSNLVVNYQADITESYGTKPDGASGGNVFSCLIIPKNVMLNVPSGRKITVNGILGYTQPDASATLARGVILNEGTINVNGTFNSYGYTKGSGKIIAENGASVNDVLRSFDWCGGTAATSLYVTATDGQKVIPFDAWSLHNISCETKIKYGSKLYAQYYGWGGEAVVNAVILSSSASDKCIFVMNNSSSFCIKKALPSSTNSATDEAALQSISGSNQIMGQKDVVELYGSFSDASFSIAVNSVTLSASTSIVLPVGYMDVVVKGKDESNNDLSSSLSITKCDFLFFPGTTVTVEKNASITTGSGADLILENAAHVNSAKTIKGKISSSYACFANRCVDFTDSVLNVEGTFNANGSVAGNVRTSTKGAKFVTGSGFGAVTYAVYNDTSSKRTYKVSNMYSQAYIGSATTLTNFNKSTTYTSEGTYFGGTGGGASNLSGTIAANDPSCLLPDTLITMADGTKKAVKDIRVGDMVLVFNHLTGQYQPMPIIFNNHLDSAEDFYNVLDLIFSDGTNLEIVGNHGLFDSTLKKYVFIDEYNFVDYIGHSFIKSTNGIDNYTVSLISGSVEERLTRVYSPISYFYMNILADDVLTVGPPVTEDGRTIEGFVNYFEFNSDASWDLEAMQRDLELYGTYLPEDFEEYISAEAFWSSPGIYLKVAVGKGIMTYQDIIDVITYLLHRSLIDSE